MIRLSILIAFIFLVKTYTYSQRDLKDGYIITNTNDTIRGQIDFKTNMLNERKCDFKDTNGSIRSYYPFEINAYRILNSKFYISKEITIEGEKHSVFLEYLVDGIVELYYYKTTGKDHYFIEKEGVLYELTNELEVRENREGVAHKLASNKYVGMLTYLFSDSQLDLEKIRNSDFGYKPLINLTEDYHRSVCDEYECIVYSRPSSRKIYLDSYAGLISSSLKLTTSNNVANDLKPIIGANLRLQSIKSDFLNFYAGLNISYNSFQGIFKDEIQYNGRNSSAYYIIEAEHATLRLPVGVEYAFTTKRVKPYISLGVVNSFLLAIKDDVRLSFDEGETTFDAYEEFNSYQLALAGGVGLKYNTFNDTFLFVKAEFEYRFPSVGEGNILNTHYVNSILINCGFSIGLNSSKD